MPRRRHLCRKKRFISREYAERVRELMERRYGVEFNVYICPLCPSFHVGHKRKEDGADACG